MALALLQEQQKAALPVGNTGHLLLGFLKYYGRVFDLEVGWGACWACVACCAQAVPKLRPHAASAVPMPCACQVPTAGRTSTQRCPTHNSPAAAWLATQAQGQAVAPKQGGIVPKSDVPAAVAAAAAARGRPLAATAPARLCVEDPLTGRDVGGSANRIAQVGWGDQWGCCRLLLCCSLLALAASRCVPPGVGWFTPAPTTPLLMCRSCAPRLWRPPRSWSFC